MSSLLKKQSLLLQKSSKSPFIDSSKTIKKSYSQEILMDQVYENERGFKQHKDWKFHKKYLLPTDPPPFCDQNGKFCVDIRFYSLPIGYAWVSDWIIDLNGPVDDSGWSYSESYKSIWSGSIPSKATVLVRRRKWTRMRRMVATTMPKVLEQGAGAGTSTDALTGKIQRQSIDRQRIIALREHLLENENKIIEKDVLGAVLEEFDYEGSRLDACLLFKDILRRDEGLLKVAMHSLRFYSDRKALVDATGVKFSDIGSVITADPAALNLSKVTKAEVTSAGEVHFDSENLTTTNGSETSNRTDIGNSLGPKDSSDSTIDAK